MTAHRPLVEWRPRDWNAGADFMCNYAMNSGSSQHWIDEVAIRNSLTKGCNLRIHSDGGLRPGICAAAGWTLHGCTLEEDGWKIQTLAQIGIFLPSTETSFTAEVLGIGSALEVVERILLTP